MPNIEARRLWCLVFLLFYLLPYAQLTVPQRDSLPTKGFQPREFIVPAGLILTGSVLSSDRIPLKKEIVNWRNRTMPNFRTHADDLLLFAPIAAYYTLDALGVKLKTDITNGSVILLKSELLALGAVEILKKTTHVMRSDGSNYYSFPSGHTAEAFAAAAFLSEEYGARYRWLPFASYGVASAVGMLRMANNKHYISDVLVGAGIGLLSTKVAYLTHRYRWNRKKGN